MQYPSKPASLKPVLGLRAPWKALHRLPSLMIGASLLMAAAGGCQDESGIPLSHAGLSQSADTAARLLRLDECADLPAAEEHVRRMVTLVNAERAKHRLPPLRAEATLMQIADFYACRMAEAHFFAHVDPYDGSTVDSRATSFGYPFMKIGENLATGQRAAEEVFDDWMKSPGHRANILDPAFTEIGVSVKLGGPNGPYWVQEFGRPYSDPGELQSLESANTPELPTPSSGPAVSDSEQAPASTQIAD